MSRPDRSPASADRRERLLDELRRIERGLEASEATALSILTDRCRVGGPPPLAALEDQRMLAGLRERDRHRVREVLAALGRLAAGRYGSCEACGAVIAEGRLEVLPTARTCAACATTATEPGQGR